MKRDKSLTLHDDDIATCPRIGRRTALLGGAAAVLAQRSAHAAATDTDAGARADPPSAQMGSDLDRGPKADPGGSRYARNRGQRGPTDRDSGAAADPAGSGRGERPRATDSDQGPKADRASGR